MQNLPNLPTPAILHLQHIHNNTNTHIIQCVNYAFSALMLLAKWQRCTCVLKTMTNCVHVYKIIQ